MGSPQPRFSDLDTVHQARRNLLQTLRRNTSNSELAELAGELLAGNVTPRTVFESNLYSEALTSATERLAEWYSNLSEAEKEKEAERGAEAIRQFTDDAANPPRRAPRRAHTSSDEEEDLSDKSWFDG